jgi:hypothetical protein
MNQGNVTENYCDFCVRITLNFVKIAIIVLSPEKRRFSGNCSAKRKWAILYKQFNDPLLDRPADRRCYRLLQDMREVLRHYHWPGGAHQMVSMGVYRHRIYHFIHFIRNAGLVFLPLQVFNVLQLLNTERKPSITMFLFFLIGPIYSTLQTLFSHAKCIFYGIQTRRQKGLYGKKLLIEMEAMARHSALYWMTEDALLLGSR